VSTGPNLALDFPPPKNDGSLFVNIDLSVKVPPGKYDRALPSPLDHPVLRGAFPKDAQTQTQDEIFQSLQLKQNLGEYHHLGG